MVSVIIPVYNREKYIEECLRSVLAQSYQDFEIILVDDGSTDNTGSICSKMAADDARIKVFAGEHKGVSAARNIALDAATGEYVFFLDSDDIIHPMLLETLVIALETGNADMATTKTKKYRENNWNSIQYGDTSSLGHTFRHSHGDTLAALFGGDAHLSLLIGTMIRTDYIANTRFKTNLFIGEDYFFLYENLVKGTACFFLEEVWYYQRLHQNNTSWNYDYNAFWSRFYRRELVWKSEERFGRKQYADIQKRDAFASFTTCIRKHKPYSEDSKKMCQVLRKYRKEIMRALPVQSKFFYGMFCFFPATALALLRLKDKLK